MIDNKCSKHFLKKYYSKTTTDEDDFLVYRRRNNGRFVDKNGIKRDIQFIVPHKYQAHKNVEWCNRSEYIKYLFKYLNKGPEHATFMLKENLHVDCTIGIQHVTKFDEIKTYLECRYVSTIEA